MTRIAKPPKPRKPPTPGRLLLPAILALCMAEAAAVDFSYQGFGTVAAGRTLGAGQYFLADPVRFAAYDNEWSAAKESRIGLRVRGSLNDTWSATVQGMSTASEQGRIELQWATINYNLNPDWSVMLGRRQEALYYYSDFAGVGYAYHWIRPPPEIYGISPFSSVDGLHALGKTVWAGWRWQFSGSVGYSENQRYSDDSKTYFRTTSGGQYESATTIGRQRVDAQVLASYDNWTLGATVSSLDYRRVLSDGRQITPSPARGDAIPALYYALIGRWENRHAFVIGEAAYVHSTQDGMLNPIYAGYVSTGAKFGMWTPHFTWAANGQRREISQSIQRSFSQTVGLRADVSQHAALKLEYTRNHVKGNVDNAQFLSPARVRGANVFSAAVDFTF